MGWRSTGAAFRAGNYNGPLTSDEGGFASGFAKTFTAGIPKHQTSLLVKCSHSVTRSVKKT
jgi:hypothetical protein